MILETMNVKTWIVKIHVYERKNHRSYAGEAHNGKGHFRWEKSPLSCGKVCVRGDSKGRIPLYVIKAIEEELADK